MARNNNETIKVTLEDLAGIAVPENSRLPTATVTASSGKKYGSIANQEEQASEVAEQRGSILLQGWFYLGLAGLAGALVGWGICEPWFVEGGHPRWGNIWILPAMLTFQCLGFGIAESIVERSLRKALSRGGLSLLLGVVLGFLFNVVAQIVFNIAVSICTAAGVHSFRNPAFWVARGIAWMVFGVAGGVVYGIAGQSSKKTGYGILGGIIGAGIGGMIFDPISMVAHGAVLSRGVGFGLLGMSTGIAMGLVESALKDRWLYVTAGPLAGKQFILYKMQTTIGSSQQCDIYLFKDSNILPQHASVEINGARVQVRAAGEMYVSGQRSGLQVLQNGASLQIGRYTFRYQERQKK
ncbi:MAG TPA: FHA domain-containing protein [Terriglobales bacterium]|nr:FHA domain-containing protein [Terriglobales bacterium]